MPEFLHAAEGARVVEGVEEVDDDAPPNLLFYSLETVSATEELFKSETLAVVDDVVVGQDHEAGCKSNPTIWISADQHFLREKLEASSSSTDFLDIDYIQPFVKSRKIDPMYDTRLFSGGCTWVDLTIL